MDAVVNKGYTLRDGINEYANWMHSADRFNLLKEITEATLLDQYIENQNWVIENADSIKEYEGMFIEAAGDGKLAKLNETAEGKKKNIFKRLWDFIIGGLKKLGKIIKRWFTIVLAKLSYKIAACKIIWAMRKLYRENYKAIDWKSEFDIEDDGIGDDDFELVDDDDNDELKTEATSQEKAEKQATKAISRNKGMNYITRAIAEIYKKKVADGQIGKYINLDEIVVAGKKGKVINDLAAKIYAVAFGKFYILKNLSDGRGVNQWPLDPDGLSKMVDELSSLKETDKVDASIVDKMIKKYSSAIAENRNFTVDLTANKNLAEDMQQLADILSNSYQQMADSIKQESDRKTAALNNTPLSPLGAYINKTSNDTISALTRMSELMAYNASLYSDLVATTQIARNELMQVTKSFADGRVRAKDKK